MKPLGCYGLFDNTSPARLDAGLNLAKTLLVCFVLSIGSMTFNKDTNDLVLEPIESMIEKITRRFSYNRKKRFLSYALLGVPSFFYSLIRSFFPSWQTGHCAQIHLTIQFGDDR